MGRDYSRELVSEGAKFIYLTDGAVVSEDSVEISILLKH